MCYSKSHRITKNVYAGRITMQYISFPKIHIFLYSLLFWLNLFYFCNNQFLPEIQLSSLLVSFTKSSNRILFQSTILSSFFRMLSSVGVKFLCNPFSENSELSLCHSNNNSTLGLVFILFPSSFLLKRHQSLWLCSPSELLFHTYYSNHYRRMTFPTLLAYSSSFSIRFNYYMLRVMELIFRTRSSSKAKFCTIFRSFNKVSEFDCLYPFWLGLAFENDEYQSVKHITTFNKANLQSNDYSF